MSTQSVTLEAQKSILPIPVNHDAYPPIEKFQTIDGLLKCHAAEQDQKPLICYPKSGVDDFEEHAATDIDRHTDQAVQYYIENGLESAVGDQMRRLGNCIDCMTGCNSREGTGDWPARRLKLRSDTLLFCTQPLRLHYVVPQHSPYGTGVRSPTWHDRLQHNYPRHFFLSGGARHLYRPTRLLRYPNRPAQALVRWPGHCAVSHKECRR